MNQFKFDKTKFEELISEMEDEVTFYSELNDMSFPNESISSPTMDMIFSMYDELDKSMSNYISSLENMLDSLQQVGDSIASMDERSANLLNI